MSDKYLDCKYWVENNLYEELCKMPIWTDAAFGQLNDGDVLDKDDSRVVLIRYLVNNHIHKIPDAIYDNDFRHNWKIHEFIPVIKKSVELIQKAKQPK